ncbi:predicted protein [Histoplasma mississippiense (nom. inval.)]|uniref:predicted protein n=1 Tax=Ajellomyces capsulatus (strain NAm1 / WU24) TaxID=2059318 RepID=UPI000157B471|nr:predicted protein [Histoplasma mississippiense (nom. inval.)]EDN02336.1 predicted protein [Histoplasma mississippiense (nom. inval.)]
MVPSRQTSSDRERLHRFTDSPVLRQTSSYTITTDMEAWEIRRNGPHAVGPKNKYKASTYPGTVTLVRFGMRRRVLQREGPGRDVSVTLGEVLTRVERIRTELS